MTKVVQSSSIVAASRGKIALIKSALAAPAKDEFLVKTLFSGISAGTERKTLLGEIPSFHKHWNSSLRIYQQNKSTKTFPVSLGYECVGEVIKVGEEVTSVKIGDNVWVDGSHSQYHLLNESKSKYMLLPTDLDPREATFLPLTRVALGAVHDSNVKLGDVVVVI